MRIQNISRAKQVVFQPKDEKGRPKGEAVVVKPGEIFDVLPSHPEKLQKLADHYPRDWRVVEFAAPAPVIPPVDPNASKGKDKGKDKDKGGDADPAAK